MSTNRFTEQEVQQYKEKGYMVAESLIDKAELDRIDKAIRELTDKALAMDDPSSILELEPEEVDGQRIPRRIYNAFAQHDAFHDLGINTDILDRVEQLIGPNFQLMLSKLNMKPAKVGSVVEWHQDLAYFPSTNDDILAILVYLDEATEENGCLQALPGQHKGYLNHTAPDGTFAGMVTEDLSDGSHGEPEALPAPAGSVIFMHSLVPHSSYPNRSDKPRRTVIYEYRASDCYPIYFGEMVLLIEECALQVRGEPAKRARFGPITPIIPFWPERTTSLYDLQTKTKERLAIEGMAKEV